MKRSEAKSAIVRSRLLLQEWAAANLHKDPSKVFTLDECYRRLNELEAIIEVMTEKEFIGFQNRPQKSYSKKQTLF